MNITVTVSWVRNSKTAARAMVNAYRREPVKESPNGFTVSTVPFTWNGSSFAGERTFALPLTPANIAAIAAALPNIAAAAKAAFDAIDNDDTLEVPPSSSQDFDLP